MAKSQKHSGREPKKPKATVKKVAAPASIFDDSRQPPKKKTPTEPRPART